MVGGAAAAATAGGAGRLELAPREHNRAEAALAVEEGHLVRVRVRVNQEKARLGVVEERHLASVMQCAMQCVMQYVTHYMMHYAMDYTSMVVVALRESACFASTAASSTRR